jgi:hypothetical protein
MPSTLTIPHSYSEEPCEDQIVFSVAKQIFAFAQDDGVFRRVFGK